MFGGFISKRGKMVEGSLRQHAWQDTYEMAYPIRYDGEFTPTVIAAIKVAWEKYERSLPQVSSYGALRWPGPSNFVRVDVENKQVIIAESTMLAD